MKKLISMNVAILLIVGSLTACTNRDMGTVGGAALGGVAGSALTGGSALGTVAGVVGGGIVGNQLAK
jgi:osmotically inducible lipoprotein OsmB